MEKITSCSREYSSSQSEEYKKPLLSYRSLNFEDSMLISCALVVATQLENVGSATAMHDMYSQRGFVGLGLRVFKNLPNRNILSY
ncbi:hypothetical protein SADUNF_Sadunf15G0072400 [Salix dunnii]|uniref:Uncharacterized protein n=1 Tax=Salix dunnii TaxID=1413687 RepID=A0A835MNV9_9ROSI|nr:hypothetical protein SADUNF_Sadunf15G0072400 [Salix dunnii]